MPFRKKMILLLLMLVFFVLILIIDPVKADALESMQTNLNMSIADIIMIIVSCGCIVIGAIDARIAIFCAFLLYASCFIAFTLATEEGISGFNPYYSGVAMMLCFVIVVLLLLISYKKANTPINVV